MTTKVRNLEGTKAACHRPGSATAWRVADLRVKNFAAPPNVSDTRIPGYEVDVRVHLILVSARTGSTSWQPSTSKSST